MIVANPDEQYSYTLDRYGHQSNTVRYRQLSFMGHTDGVDMDWLRSFSPQHHAADVQIPILLMHGKDDTVVEVNQSRSMNRALERAGKDVSYVELDGGDHWLLEYETRLRVLTEMEAFLGEHLGD